MQGQGSNFAKQGTTDMPHAYQKVEVTLIENSTAGNPPKRFAGQTVEITHEPDTVQTSVDAFTSYGRHPSKIFWRGGIAKSFASITHVKIAAASGEVLVDGQLISTFQAPQDVSGGVKFEILMRDSSNSNAFNALAMNAQE